MPGQWTAGWRWQWSLWSARALVEACDWLGGELALEVIRVWKVKHAPKVEYAVSEGELVLFVEDPVHDVQSEFLVAYRPSSAERC